MQFQYDDGGRAEAGYKGSTGDCGVRALAIAADMPYQEACDLVNKFAATERSGKRRGRGRSSVRGGIYASTYKRIMAHLGWKWIACMGIGTGCKVHLRSEELPPGRLIVRVSKHYAAVIDGVLHDTYDHSQKRVEIGAVNGVPYRKEWFRCVYGYWIKEA